MNALNAKDSLKMAIKKHNVNLGVLVAETSIWANQAVHQYLLNENGKGSWQPKVRRAKQGEARRTITEDGTYLDDNTTANRYLKLALGGDVKYVDYEVCHIWPKSCYDEYHHTTIANLVLLPRAIASLSDHDESIENILKYRAFELYHWYPEREEKPQKPDNYPGNWTEPMPFSERIEKSLKRRKFA